MSKEIPVNAYYTITEFSDITGISVDTLRRLDKTGLFHPAERGDGRVGKHRYYNPTQIVAVKTIHVLMEIGVQADIIKSLSENRTPVDLLQLLFEQQELVENELRFLQEVHSVISTFYGLLNEGLRAIESKIYVTEQPEKKIILGGENNFNGDERFYKEFIRFCTAIHEPILNITYPIGGFFEDIDVFLETPSQPTRFFSLDPHGNDNKPKGLYLVGYTRGYYGQTNDLPQLMAAFARKDGLRFNGPVYNIYVQDELSIKDPNQYLLQVSASVKETRRSRRPGHHL